MSLSAYLRLMRINKPVGIILLWMPTAWALWVANHGRPSFILMLYFFIGTFLMRAAGCIVNDIADRKFDKYVARTQARPLTTGEIQLKEAIYLFIGLLFLAFVIVLQLPLRCLLYAFIALGVTIIYPFCKRFFQAPQLVLGIAFSMAIPMAFVASGVKVNREAGVLIMINLLWVMSYDTMYAMVDRKDDLKIGIKSTAVLLADWDKMAIFVLQVMTHGLWLLLAAQEQFNLHFYFAWIAGGIIFAYQQVLINTRKEAACFKAFLFNAWYGTILWIGLMASV